MNATESACEHKAYYLGHCGSILCWNYLSKCPKHAFKGNPSNQCTIVAHEILEREKSSDND